MAARPHVIPDPFNGSGEARWEQWIGHFENVAAVNDWDDANKLKWLKVRLTGRAQAAFDRLSDENKNDYKKAKDALQERFEPAARKHRYQAEMQIRRKKKGESWADFADDLRFLADKAYPELQVEGRERLALNNYLAQLDNPQVAFAVKQRNPQSLDAAVSATLELEAYATQKATTASVSSVMEEEESSEIAVGAVGTTDKLTTLVEKLMERMERLEKGQTSERKPAKKPSQPRQQRWEPRNPRSKTSSDDRREVVCWNCQEPGHLRRDCRSRIEPPGPAERQQQRQQGN